MNSKTKKNRKAKNRGCRATAVHEPYRVNPERLILILNIMFQLLIVLNLVAQR